MSKILVRHVQRRSSMKMRRLPFLARFYRYAFTYQRSRKRELFVDIPLQKLFRVFRCLAAFPHWGEFTYERMNHLRVIRFDSRNLQFQALYHPLWEHGYEQDVTTLVDIFLPKSGTLYDIGSNWGFCTLHAASKHPELSVHAFEPHPSTFQDLTSCVQQAGLAGVVTCHNIALSNTVGESFIDLPDRLHSGAAELNIQGLGARIRTTPLDALDLPKPDVIKIDVEGHERQVFEGSKQLLQRARPFLIFESKRRDTSAAVTLEPLRYLADLGYELYVPAVKRETRTMEYFVPYGMLLQTGQMQGIEPTECFALVPFEPDTRFFFQTDINVFASHRSRRDVLLSEFTEHSGPHGAQP